MDMEKSQRIFPALTGIRAIAAYLVYVNHTNPFTAERFGNFIHQLVNQFHIGVSIFFVLSGFLITLRYYDSSVLNGSWIRKYIQNRIARVYPMYFILTSFTLIILILQNREGQHPMFTYIMNITFLKGFFDDFKFTLIAQGWSLTVEECFYFSAPLLFIGFRKSKWSIFFFTGIFFTIGLLLVVTFSDVNFYGFFSSYSFLFTYTFPGRCIEFFMGASLVILFQSKFKQEKQGIFFTCTGGTLMIFLVILMTSLNMSDKTFLSTIQKIITSNFLLPAGIIVFFYGLITEQTLVKKILSSSLFLMLGKSSYTFYLIHLGVIYSFINSYLPNDFLLTFFLINLISIGLWYSLEEPLNRLIKNI